MVTCISQLDWPSKTRETHVTMLHRTALRRVRSLRRHLCSIAPTPPSPVPSSSTAPSVQIVQYNILSDALCSPSYFSSCAPADCDPALRLERVQERLRAEMRDKEAILCLQEVSRDWLGQLLPFLEAEGYGHVGVQYGNPFDGYMGVSLAYPRRRYQLDECRTVRVGDTVRWPRVEREPRPPAAEGDAKKSTTDWWQPLASLAGAGASAGDGAGAGAAGDGGSRDAKSSDSVATGGKEGKPPRRKSREEQAWGYPWAETKRRFNCVALSRLKDKDNGGRSFSVGTYHMPCLFGSSSKLQVMVAHTAMMAQEAQRFAGGDPLILAGDFNFKPYDACYALLQNGELPEDHALQPPLPAPFDAAWKAKVKPMRSAYVARSGVEPAFTNYARTARDEETFVECLDYIWLSDEWKVADVAKVPESPSLLRGPKGEVAGVGTKPGEVPCVSLPNADEPSDHLMIGCELRL